MSHEPLTVSDVDFILERFDQTDPEMQRHIVASLMVERAELIDALAACERVMDTAAMLGNVQREGAYSESWAQAHSEARELLARLQPKPEEAK